MKEYFSHSDPFQAKDRPRDSKPGEKVDSSAEEGEERQEAEGGRHLRHQRGGLQVTYFLDIQDSKPFHHSRVKDLRSPAKKWKLEKNAQQLYMTGTVLLYQVFVVLLNVDIANCFNWMLSKMLR